MARRKGWACLQIGLERWSCRMEWALQSTPARRRRLVSPPLVQGQLTLGPSNSFVGFTMKGTEPRLGNFVPVQFKAFSREAIEQSRTQHAAHKNFKFCDATLSPTTEARASEPQCGSECRSKSLRFFSTGHIRASTSDRPAQVAAAGPSRPRQPQRPLSLSLPCHLERHRPRLSQ